MIPHRLLDDSVDDPCYPLSYIAEALSAEDMKTQAKAFTKIQTYVLVTILVLVLQLGYLLKPFAYGFFRILSWGSYFLVPALISYILGLMMQPRAGYDLVPQDLTDSIRYLTCVWAIFLLFAYTGFDNLNAFNIEERSGRAKLFLQLGIQFVLLLLILYQLPRNTNVVPIAFVFIVLSFKFLERLVALAHSDGATPRIKRGVGKIIDFMNNESLTSPNAMTMEGFNYLVGPKYSTVKDKKIVDGITVEKIWGCQGRLLSGNTRLKDNCLSFSLFWLLLGKFLSYPLYEQGNKYSRTKARKLVLDGLIGDEGGHERVFRVIEVELAFLRDYFHAKYIFFYLNGFFWKLISVVAYPLMFWWFTQKAIDYQKLKDLGYTHPHFTYTANTIVVSVILALELLQLLIFITSRWTEVTLICHYVEKKSKSDSSDGRPWSWCWFIEMIGSVLLVSSCMSRINTWWRKPWKREIGQYSLVESCTTLPRGSSFLKLHVVSILGLPLPKPGRKQSPNIAISEQIKETLVLSLQKNDLKLTNGITSLRQNGVLEDFSWACELNKDTEIILVWHIATTICEMHPSSQEKSSQSANYINVATSLSKYCAYLLFFATSLLPVPVLEAESICDDLIEDASELFNKSGGFNWCGKTTEAMVKYEKMMELIISDKEIGSDPKSCSVLRKGAKLGYNLVSLVRDEEKRWKILAELWAEMILYLTPSNINETAHAEKLSEGGEFITHLWALLIHAGITDRDDMAAAFQKDVDESHQLLV